MPVNQTSLLIWEQVGRLWCRAWSSMLSYRSSFQTCTIYSSLFNNNYCWFYTSLISSKTIRPQLRTFLHFGPSNPKYLNSNQLHTIRSFWASWFQADSRHGVVLIASYAPRLCTIRGSPSHGVTKELGSWPLRLARVVSFHLEQDF